MRVSVLKCGTRSSSKSYLLTTVCREALLLGFLDSFTNLQKTVISFVMSVSLPVRPYGITGLQLDGFS